MNETPRTSFEPPTPLAGPSSDTPAEAPERHPKLGAVEEFARGEISSFHGIVNTWLLVVYAGLAVWAVYYLVKYWGGLGPGLAAGQ
jgi:hypothetical protein